MAKGVTELVEDFKELHPRAYARIYNQALEDLQKMIDCEYYDGGYGTYHEVEMIVRMIEQLRK